MDPRHGTSWWTREEVRDDTGFMRAGHRLSQIDDYDRFQPVIVQNGMWWEASPPHVDRRFPSAGASEGWWLSLPECGLW